MVVCTQPRQMHAIAVAERVSLEMGAPPGTVVGISLRSCRRLVDGETRIVFGTPDVLVREIMSDPLLSRYSVVCIDEAHSRSISTDLFHFSTASAMFFSRTLISSSVYAIHVRITHANLRRIAW